MCFNLDQYKFLSSVNGLNTAVLVLNNQHSLEFFPWANFTIQIQLLPIHLIKLIRLDFKFHKTHIYMNSKITRTIKALKTQV